MSNTARVAKPEVVSKIAPANFAPKRLLGQPDTVRELSLGVLVGIVSKIVVRHDAAGNSFEGFGGTFEYSDEFENKSKLQSGVLFLPAGVFDMVAEACDAAFGTDKETGEVRTGSVRIAMRAKVFRADNPQGYSWKYEQLMEPEAHVADPLADLRALAGVGPSAPAIEDKTGGAAPEGAATGEPATAEPAKGKAK